MALFHEEHDFIHGLWGFHKSQSFRTTLQQEMSLL
jgi:hypothetical protein